MWAAGLLLTSNQNRDDYAIITINLHADVVEEFPVVPLKLTVSTVEVFQPIYDEPFVRRSYFNLPSVENPLSEGGLFAKMTTGTTGNLRKIDAPEFDEDDGEPYQSYAYIESTETSVRDAYYTPTQFGNDTQVMIQTYRMGSSGANPWGIADLYMNIQNPGTATPSYYRLRVNRGGGGAWVISRFDAGVETVLGSQNWGITPGDWIVFRRAGNTLTGFQAYYDWVSGPPESEDDPDPDYFPYGDQVITVNDSTINEPGYVGFGANHIAGLRNFFAGDALTEMLDEEEVYLKITPITKLEGIAFKEVHFSFDDLDEWTIWSENENFDMEAGLNRHFTISRKHASEGDHALRIESSTLYPFKSTKMQWLAVDGGLTDTEYWIGYSFYIQDWKDIWMAGNFSGDGNGYPSRLPGFCVVDGVDDLGWNIGPTLRATSQAAGEMLWFDAQYPTMGYIPLNHKQWYAVKMSWTHDSATDDYTGRLWLDDVFVDEATLNWANPKPILGIALDMEQVKSGGQIYIDDMSWWAGTEPATASDTETGDQTTNGQQWIKLRERLNAQTQSASISLEIDPDYVDTYPSAWIYTEMYIPTSLDDFGIIGNNDSTWSLLETDAFDLYIERIGSTSNFRWNLWTRGSPNIESTLGNVTLGQWYRIHAFYDGNNPGAGVTLIINQDSYNCPVSVSGAPGGVNYFSHGFPAIDITAPPNGYVWYGVDNMAWSENEPVSSYAYNYVVDFEGENPLAEYELFYPAIPVFVQLGPGDYIITDHEGGYGPGPGLPIGSVDIRMEPSAEHEVSLSTFGEVYLNLTAVSGGTYVDDVVVPFKLSVLGGECHSTWSGDNVGVGDAYLRWSSTVNLRWSSEQELRWSPGEVSTGETIHC